MKIRLTSVMVENQEKALDFYTRVLGFVKRMDMPAGEYRWLTVVTPADPCDIQLSLEPAADPDAKAFQKALHDKGTPWTAFAVDDVQQEYERLTRLGVVFPVPPTPAGPTIRAVLDDTCGNLIQIFQLVAM